VNLLIVQPELSESPTFHVFTAETSATIPNLSAAGLPLPTSTTYFWELISFGPQNTVDAMAVGRSLDQLLGAQEGYYSIAGERSFTTGP
jgi:hypothetical protein